METPLGTPELPGGAHTKLGEAVDSLDSHDTWRKGKNLRDSQRMEPMWKSTCTWLLHIPSVRQATILLEVAWVSRWTLWQGETVNETLAKGDGRRRVGKVIVEVMDAV